MLVGEVVVEELLLDLATLAVSLVVNAETSLFLDRVTLVVKVVFRDCQTLHAIGFEEESEIVLVGGKPLKVVGTVFVGGAFNITAVIENEHEMLTRTDVL